MDMRRRAIVTIGLVTGLFLEIGAHAVSSDLANNPYGPVVGRNVFDLRDPPPPPEPKPETPPPSKVQLLGIASMGGKTTVVLKSLEPPKPGEPPTEPFVLAEGEAQQDIEVQQIDEAAGAVKIINHGKAMTLTFKEDGVKLASAPAPGAPAPAPLPGPPRPGLPPPRALAQAAPASSAPTPPLVIGSARGRSTATTTRNVSNASGSPTAGTMASLGGAQGMPTRPVRTSEPPTTLEESIVLMELERERTRDLVKALELPPLPPTELTPAEDMPPMAPSPGFPGLPSQP